MHNIRKICAVLVLVTAAAGLSPLSAHAAGRDHVRPSLGRISHHNVADAANETYILAGKCKRSGGSAARKDRVIVTEADNSFRAKVYCHYR